MYRRRAIFAGFCDQLLADSRIDNCLSEQPAEQMVSTRLDRQRRIPALIKCQSDI